MGFIFGPALSGTSRGLVGLTRPGWEAAAISAAIFLMTLPTLAALCRPNSMYQCRHPPWRHAPVSSAWAFLSAPSGTFYNDCPAAGTFGIRQTPSGSTGNDGGSALRLDVPPSHPNVTIAGVQLRLMVAPKTGNG